MLRIEWNQAQLKAGKATLKQLVKHQWHGRWCLPLARGQITPIYYYH